MTRQTVYGKRSRAIYDQLPAAVSSPEEPRSKPTASKKGKKPEQNTDVKQEANVKVRRSPRKALGEKSHNAVVLPIEAIQHSKSLGKPRVRKKGHIVWDSEDEAGDPGRDSISYRAGAEPVESLEEGLKSLSLRKEPDTIDQVTQALSDISIHQRERQQPKEVEHVELPGRKDPDLYASHCVSLLDLSTHPLTCFKSWSEQLSEHFSVTKIAEASFGEVYRLSLHEDLSAFASTDESVFKIIPLRSPESTLPLDKRKRKAAWTKQEGMSKPDDVATEVKLLQRMSDTPGFTRFRDVRILQGRPPKAFVQAFKKWNTEQKKKKKDPSHFPDPSKKSSYDEDQLWAIIEMQDAGTDLERLVEEGKTTSIFTIWDTFWQVVLSLAKGEEGAEFEHRDLHLGNICVRSSSPTSTDSSSAIDTKRKLNFTNLETTIIDYTISRCLMPTHEIAHQDLSLDPTLFEGDSTDEYQYDIYRYMRSALYLDDPLAQFHERTEDVEASGRTWEQYHPQTNLVWLHLVLYKLLEQVDWPSARKAPSRNKRKDHAQWKRANELEHVLLKVQDLLDPGEICQNGICSSGDLVVLALGEGWLDVENVVGRCLEEESALISQLDGLQL